MQFMADARNGSSQIDACGNGCCCEQAVIAPGEVAKMRINYAGWLAAIRANSLVVSGTDVVIERISVGGALVGSDLSFSLATPGTLNATVALASDIAGASYALAAGPKFGAVSLATDGAFTYIAAAKAASADMFVVAVTMGGKTTMRRVGLDLIANADFAFIATAERSYVGSLLTADTPSGAKFTLGGASTWSPVYNGPVTPIGAAPNDVATLIAGASGFVTTGKCLLGNVQVRSDGQFIYGPHDHVSGLDGFAVDIYNPDGTLWKSKVVSIELPALRVDRNGILIKGPFLQIPVATSRDAEVGAAYRLTVFQMAQDCDGGSFVHRSCYDIAVAKC